MTIKKYRLRFRACYDSYEGYKNPERLIRAVLFWIK